MAGSNTIGTGAVVLTANADALLTGLKKAEKDTESWAQRTGKNINGVGESLEKINKIPNLLGLGFVGAIATVGSTLAGALGNAVTRGDQLNKALERSIELGDRFAKMMDRRTEANAARLEAMSATPTSRATEIDRQLRALDPEIGAAETAKHLAEFQRDVTLINSGVKASKTGLERMAEGSQLVLAWFAQSLETYQAPFEANFKAADARLQKAIELRAELTKARDNIIDPDKDVAKEGEVDRLSEAFERQAAALGKTAEQAKMLDLIADGFSERQIRQFTIAADKLTKTTEGFESVANAVGGAAGFVGGGDSEKIKEITAALKKQSDTWGMTANQIQLYDLRIAKFAERQIKEVEKLQDSTESLLNTFNIASSIANGVKDTKLESGGPYVSGAALGNSLEAYSQVANFRASNAIAGGSIGDNPVQIQREVLKVLKEQKRDIRQLIDIMKGAQQLKVVT
ncbi:hypothetical protein J8F10_30440 [Gemmata sp. G18]|uniref:Uncharacterized protein n=1 Tax=Gemmata palustris TaxID=2822762 RepID=A0ABS5C290_9BACT|nr:hypothetical protein [Gemmata palustris]MBP3959585.1 hypothetical protein [Gemmata palustris]